MMSEWAIDEARSELWQLIDDISAAEELPLHRIREACSNLGIDCYKFNSLWIKLVDESHLLISKAESKMEELPYDGN